MNTPRRIQRKRTKGWKMPANAVYVGRPSSWGNPYKVGDSMDQRQIKKGGWAIRDSSFVCQDALQAKNMFALIVAHDHAYQHGIKKMLKGKNLACFCPLDQPCHADVLLELANA